MLRGIGGVRRMMGCQDEREPADWGSSRLLARQGRDGEGLRVQDAQTDCSEMRRDFIGMLGRGGGRPID